MGTNYPGSNGFAVAIGTSRWRRWAVLVAAGVVVAVTARLGLWQLDRAQQKQRLSAQLTQQAALPAASTSLLPRANAAADELAAWRGRPAQISGHWLPGSTVFLENRQMNGRPGFYVVSALKLRDRPEALLVQRGWAPRDVNDRARVPAVPLPSGEITLQGRMAPAPARLHDFGGVETGPLRQNIDLDERRASLGVPVLPMSLQQTATGAADDGLVREWPEPSVDIHKHHGYAFQWFALSALTAGLYVWFQIIRPRRRR